MTGHLSEKQERFCEEYLIDCNATQAAIRAGYSGKTAYSMGQRLLKKVEVQNRIAELGEAARNERTADAAEVMEYLTAVLRGESTATVVVVESVGDGCSEARALTKPPDEKERLKAAELLGKRFGLFTDKLSVDGNIPVVIAGDGEIRE